MVTGRFLFIKKGMHIQIATKGITKNWQALLIFSENLPKAAEELIETMMARGINKPGEALTIW